MSKYYSSYRLHLTILIFTFVNVILLGQTDLNEKEIRDKIEEKARQLGQNLSKICNKSIDIDSRTKLVNETMEYFVDPDNQKIEVSSIRPGSSITTYSVRQYLNHILVYKKFETVELVWEYTSLIENLTKVKSGDFEGTLRILQTFKGKGIIASNDYEDQTIKDIKVLISAAKFDRNTSLESDLIKFGNIKVKKTRLMSKSKGKA